MNTIANSPPVPLPAPVHNAPLPDIGHFPSRLHAVVWRNWDVVTASRIATTLRASVEEISAVARSMGLPPQRSIPAAETARNSTLVIRRNWHLLPYEQICSLVAWSADRLADELENNDCLWVALGRHKPGCAPVWYAPPDSAADDAAAVIATRLAAQVGPDRLGTPPPAPFSFLADFHPDPRGADNAGPLRMIYPFWLRYGDALDGDAVDDVSDAYLAEVAGIGVNAIWFQGILAQLAPWDLAPGLSAGWSDRLANLRRLVARCARHGIGVFVYLNEPRALPREFFDERPELAGVDYSAEPSRSPNVPDMVGLCTSTEPVQRFLTESVRHIFTQVPDLAGIYCITFSENITNCHYTRTTGANCLRCSTRTPEEVHAEVVARLADGIRAAGSAGRLLLDCWSMPVDWVPGLIEHLPTDVELVYGSEFDMPFTRGDYHGKITEYSISVGGPSVEAKQFWRSARARGMKAVAKIQAANSYEICSLPYIPAVRLVAEHAHRVAQEAIDGVILAWTAGGYPCANIEVANECLRCPQTDPAEIMAAVAHRRFGDRAEVVLRAWDAFSDAFLEFPFHIAVCYRGPQLLGPANLLYAQPSGLTSTMVSYPFDDLDHWRGEYSPDTLESQFRKLADRWRAGVELIDNSRDGSAAIEAEWRVAEAVRIHCQSSANQIRFIRLRDSADPDELRALVEHEISLAKQLLDIVSQDSAIGFEAPRQYYYTAADLLEKIINCQRLLADDPVGLARRPAP
jgi:hypothetical protein